MKIYVYTSMFVFDLIISTTKPEKKDWVAKKHGCLDLDGHYNHEGFYVPVCREALKPLFTEYGIKPPRHGTKKVIEFKISPLGSLLEPQRTD